ncbi:Alpha/Beta hydrolase protein [Hyaloraphidium curvatum]|nr:Alpha/Beta hydrolase protein [Hyaloraphidium curvatum]
MTSDSARMALLEASDAYPGLDAFPSLPAALPGPATAVDPKLHTRLLLVPAADPGFVIAAQLISLSPLTDSCIRAASGDPKPAANLLFCHATGIPKLAYLPVLRRLLTMAGPDRLNVVVAIDARNAGDSALNNPVFPDEPFDWRIAARDNLAVIRHLGLHPAVSGRPLVASGHSHGGGTLLMASLMEPGIISAYVGIEPISSSPETVERAAEARRKGIQGLGPDLAVGARRRKANFDSKAAALASFKSKPFFAAWDPESLLCYVEDGFHAPSGSSGVTLKTPPINESNTFNGSFSTSLFFPRLGEVRIPRVLVLSGLESEQLLYMEPGPDSPSPASWPRPRNARETELYAGIKRDNGRRYYPKDITIARWIPGANHLLVEGAGHMVPMDKPEEVAKLILGVVSEAVDDVDGWRAAAGAASQAAQAKL